MSQLTRVCATTADTFIRPGLEVSFTVVDDAQKIVPTILAASTKHIKPVDDAVLDLPVQDASQLDPGQVDVVFSLIESDAARAGSEPGADGRVRAPFCQDHRRCRRGGVA